MQIAETYNKMQTFIWMRSVAKGTEQTCRHLVKVENTPQPCPHVRPGALRHTTSRHKDRSSANTCGGQDASSGEQHFASSTLYNRPGLVWVTAPGTHPEPQPALGIPGLSMLLGRRQCPAPGRGSPTAPLRSAAGLGTPWAAAFTTEPAVCWKCVNSTPATDSTEVFNYSININ